MRYGDNFGDVAEALRMKGYNVTSLYPIEWMKRDWTPQEDRFAKEVDGTFDVTFLLGLHITSRS